MRPIFIIGFMGSGKSTLGRALSAALGISFIDLDNYIESRFHANIRDIFATRGEEGFRRIERNVLREVSEFEDVIVACGGGTPCFFDNIDVINASGLSVMLEVSHGRLFERLSHGRRRRPLIASMTDERLNEYIDEALAARMSFYSKATHRFSGEHLDSAEEIAVTVNEFITRFGLRPSDTSRQ